MNRPRGEYATFLMSHPIINRGVGSSTAKKFLASANFFELLRIFDKPAGTDVRRFLSIVIYA